MLSCIDVVSVWMLIQDAGKLPKDLRSRFMVNDGVCGDLLSDQYFLTNLKLTAKTCTMANS